MRVVSTTAGFILVFNNKREIEGLVEHLQKQLEWIEQEGIEPPHLYSQFHESTPEDDVREILEELKNKGGKKSGADDM